MLYDLVFHMNLDLGISNQLYDYHHYTFFFLSFKGFKPILLSDYTQALLTNLWLIDLQYFPLTLHS